MIFDDTIPLLSKHVTARKEPNGVLLYQKETGELYFVSDGGYQVMELLGGSHTVHELEQQLSINGNQVSETDVGGLPIRVFVEQLANRTLVELWN